MIQLRKDATKLTQMEIQQLQGAMQKVINSGTFAKLANMHGAPITICDPNSLRDRDYHRGCCPHISVEFLPWHRLLITNMDRVSLKDL